MTSPDVPRRPRPGQARRVRAALNSTGVHSAEGATAAARAVHRPGGAQIYQPAGDVVTAWGYFSLSLSDPGLPAGGAGLSGETVTFADGGSDPGYFQPGATINGIDILTDGNYTAHALVNITGCDQGDVFMMRLFSGTGLAAAGTVIADSRGNAEWGGTCSIFAVSGIVGSLQLSIGQDSGTGITPNLQQADVHINKLG